MDKFAQLKQDYQDLESFIVEACDSDGCKDSFRQYFLSCIVKIWGSNDMLYANDYATALDVTTGTSYTMEQIVTAMACSVNHSVLMPDFFDVLVRKSLPYNTSRPTLFMQKFNQLLVSASFINGDFTIPEARELTEILKSLKERCEQSGISVQDNLLTPVQQTTALRSETYIHATDTEKDTSKKK